MEADDVTEEASLVADPLDEDETDDSEPMEDDLDLAGIPATEALPEDTSGNVTPRRVCGVLPRIPRRVRVVVCLVGCGVEFFYLVGVMGAGNRERVIV